MNTVPYTNAREAGRTHPGLIEIIDRHDPRHPANRPIPSNRQTRRAAGARIGHTRPAAYRRVLSLRTVGQHPAQRAAREAVAALQEAMQRSPQAANALRRLAAAWADAAAQVEQGGA